MFERNFFPYASMCVAVLAACSSDTPPLVGESGPVRYFAYDEGGCGDERARAVEIAMERLAEELQVPLTPVDYYLVSPSRAADVCSGAQGCTDGRAIVTGLDVHPHELVHVLMMSRGDPPPVIVEGIAEAVGGHFYAGRPPLTPDPAMLSWLKEGYREHSLSFYLQSASFVRFVLERHGLTAFHELYARLPSEQGEGDSLDGAMLEITGESASSLVAAWIDAGPRFLFEVVDQVYECSSPRLIAGSWSAVELICGAGMHSGDFVSFSSVENPPTKQLALRARTENASGLSVLPRTCGGPPSFGRMIPYDEPLPLLEPGRKERILILADAPRHLAIEASFGDEPTPVELRADLGTWVSDACDSAEPVVIDEDLAELTVTPVDGRGTWIRLHPTASVELSAFGVGFNVTSITVYDTDCAAILARISSEDPQARMTLEAERDYMLHIEWSEMLEEARKIITLHIHTPGSDDV